MAEETKAAGLRTQAARSTTRDLILAPRESRHATNGEGLAALLSRLEGVRRTGPGTWVAKCPGHADKHPSLGVREKDDGLVLLKCHAGCNTEHVLASVGMTFDHLYPERSFAHHVPPERRPFPAADVLRSVAFEALVAAVAAGNMANGLPLSDADRTRLLLAAQRLQSAAGAYRA